MEWFYAHQGQRRGPVTAAQLAELLRVGTIHQETLVWHSGLTEWKPLREASPGTLSSNLELCRECQRSFPPEELVRFDHLWVCAGCKPLYLQRLVEGGVPSSHDTHWRYGRQLVLRKGAALPDRCLKCNAPAAGYRLQQKINWHHPLYYLTFLIYVVGYLVTALLVNQRAVVALPLCPRHRRRYRWLTWTSGITLMAGLAILIGGAANGHGEWVGSGILIIVVGLVLVGVVSSIVTPAKIRGGFIWLKGVTPAFLEELPEWHDPD